MPTLTTSLICLLLSATANEPQAPAADATPDPKFATRLDTIVSIGNQRAQRIAEIAGTVNVIDADAQAIHQVQNLADLVRYEPGISVVEESSRFGAQGFSIRGLDGNRVLMRVDGVPVRDAFSVGSFSRAGRAAIDPALLAQTELLRGPASTIHGSSALAGVVNFQTIGVDDLLTNIDQNWGLRARSALLTRDQSWSNAAYFGDRLEYSEWVLAYVQRSRHERDNDPRPGGLRANPQQATEHAGLIKWRTFDLPFSDLTFGLDMRDADTSTDVQSLVHGPAQYASTEAMSARDTEQDLRARLGLAFNAEALGLTSLDAGVSFARSKLDQRTQQWRAAEPPRTPRNRRDRRFVFEQDGLSFDLIGDREWQTGWATQQWTFGANFSRQIGREARDGTETNLATGAVTSVLLGEVFPLRDFPETVSDEAAVFVQDDIRFAEHWTLIPGIRYEWFAIDARPDALYRADNPNQRVSDLQDHALTGKLGLLWQASDPLQLFWQYAEGFRAPPASDLNLGFNLPAFNYVALPNPDLKPEHSRGMELGARWSGEAISAELVLFDNHYRDLIESRVNLGRNSDGQLVFQSQNRARASIHGVELRADAELPWSGFSSYARFAWTKGRDLVRAQPLNSVDPAKLSLGLVWQSPSQAHRLELVGTGIARQDEVAAATPKAFETPGTGLFDLYWRWQLSPQWTVDVAANNLTDRRWWDWSSVRGLAANAREVDLATQPGRNLSLQLGWQW